MTDILEMPNNAENAYRKARNFLIKNQFKDALPLLEQSYQLNPNPDVLVDWTFALIRTKDLTELKRIWQESHFSLQEIALQPRLAQVYIQSLFHMEKLNDIALKLYQLQEQTPAGPLKEFIEAELSKVNQALALQDQFKLSQGQEILDNLLSLPLIEQLSQLKQIYVIQSKASHHFLFQCLSHEQVSNYAKADILHYLLYHLSETELNQTIKFSWFDHDKEVNLANLTPYQEDPLYLETRPKLYDYCQSNDPHLTDAVLEQFVLQALFFYPYFQATFENEDTWLAIFLHKNQVQSVSYLDISPELDHYYDQIILELQSIFLNA